jgi:hypothetical protein
MLNNAKYAYRPFQRKNPHSRKKKRAVVQNGIKTYDIMTRDF